MITPKPYVSVLVPVRNEAAHAMDFFQPLLNQNYPKDRMEIVVIDGMSEDGTRDIVRRFIEKNGHVTVCLIDNPKRQRASAMNVGIQHATGDVILRVDARTVIGPDYVEKCVSTLVETNADNVGGVQSPIVAKNGNPGKELIQLAVGIALSHPFGIGNAQFRLGRKSGYVDTVYLGCFMKEIFIKVGLFDEDAAVIGEDTDMNHRIRKAGGKIYLNKDIVAYYYPRDNLKDLWKLYFRYGGARAGNFIKAKEFTSWRQLVPLFLLVALAVTAVGSFFSDAVFYLFIGLLLAYIAADFVVSSYLSAKHAHIWLLLILLAVFPCVHFAWATGFFRRLFQKPGAGQYWAN
jgi:glycosyltransferase involved in cell wall biosynthesis